MTFMNVVISEAKTRHLTHAQSLELAYLWLMYQSEMLLIKTMSADDPSDHSDDLAKVMSWIHLFMNEFGDDERLDYIQALIEKIKLEQRSIDHEIDDMLLNVLIHSFESSVRYTRLHDILIKRKDRGSDYYVNMLKNELKLIEPELQDWVINERINELINELN